MGDLIVIFPKPYSMYLMYLRGTITKNKEATNRTRPYHPTPLSEPTRASYHNGSWPFIGCLNQRKTSDKLSGCCWPEMSSSKPPRSVSPKPTDLLKNLQRLTKVVLRLQGFLGSTWTPKVCKIMAFRAIILGLGLLFYILLGFR